MLSTSLYSEHPVSYSFVIVPECRMRPEKLQHGLEGQYSLECCDTVCPVPVLAQINRWRQAGVEQVF